MHNILSNGTALSCISVITKITQICAKRARLFEKAHIKFEWIVNVLFWQEDARIQLPGATDVIMSFYTYTSSMNWFIFVSPEANGKI